MVELLLLHFCIWVCQLLKILSVFSFGIHCLIKLRRDFWVGNVVICLSGRGDHLVILNYVLGWKRCHLSSLLVYFLSLFKAPNVSSLLLNLYLNVFLWGRCVEIRKIMLIKWNAICLEKKNGNLGGT